ncbi:MAG: hypothetical protein KAJ42_09005, partial [Gemmatimonadetes bacterium]|nr:hypothetical protein [Gemmatimonadota bacterium]
ITGSDNYGVRLPCPSEPSQLFRRISFLAAPLSRRVYREAWHRPDLPGRMEVPSRRGDPPNKE